MGDLADLKYLQKLKEALLERGFPLGIVQDVLETIQTISAKEVTICRDCAVPHNKYTGCPMLNGLVTPPHFYCGFGERKYDG